MSYTVIEHDKDSYKVKLESIQTHSESYRVIKSYTLFTKSYRVIKSNTESCNGIQRYVESYSAVLYSIISYAKSHRVKWSNKKSYRVIQSYSESNFSHTESYKVMQNES